MELLEEFKYKNNIERYFLILNNLVYLYNISKEYHLGYKTASQGIEYIFSGSNYELCVKTLVMNYLFSMLMLGRFEEIISFIDVIIFDYKYLNPLASAIYLIAAKKTNQFNVYDNKIIKENTSKSFNIIRDFLINEDVDVLENLKVVPYLIEIKHLLTYK